MGYQKLPMGAGSKGDMMPLPLRASNQKCRFCLCKTASKRAQIMDKFL
jgi:hypothetical protein